MCLYRTYIFLKYIPILSLDFTKTKIVSLQKQNLLTQCKFCSFITIYTIFYAIAVVCCISYRAFIYYNSYLKADYSYMCIDSMKCFMHLILLTEG